MQQTTRTKQFQIKQNSLVRLMKTTFFFSLFFSSTNRCELQGSVNVFSLFKFTWQTEKLVICTGLVVNHLDSDVSLLGRTR